MPRVAQTTLEDFTKRFAHMQETAGARIVFGEPVQAEGRTIIPVAHVVYAFGLGMGAGGEQDGASGQGGGGGGGMRVRPVAIIEITGEQTKMTPVVDATRVALAGIMMAAWTVFWISLAFRKAAGGRR
jgi:uncharacterized spore protein YtfJ